MAKKTLRLVSWNVNGLRAAHRKGFLDWLGGSGADVVGLQEVKAMPEQLPGEMLDVPGYEAYFNPAERKGYSGVGIYSRVPPHRVDNGLGIPRFDVEGRVQEVDYGEFVLFNIYFPNGKRDLGRLRYKMDFYDAWLGRAKALVKKGRNVIMCGDVNTAHTELDLARPKENRKISGFLPEECAWMDRLVASGFKDTFRMFWDGSGHYTWWDVISRARERNVGWRIDYFFVNDAFAHRVKHAFILKDVHGSDHCPVGIDLAV